MTQTWPPKKNGELSVIFEIQSLVVHFRLDQIDKFHMTSSKMMPGKRGATGPNV